MSAAAAAPPWSAALLSPDGAGSGAEPAGPVLSCRPGSFGKAAADAYAHLAAWRVRFVEIALPKPEETQRVQAELRRHGLSAASLQVPIDLGSPTVGDEMGTAARRARDEFGAAYLFTSAHAGKRDLGACYAALRSAGEAADRHGVTIVLETHPDLGTNGAVAAATMRAVDHPRIRVNWDPANVYYYNENCDGRREFDQALPYVGAVHLKDTGGGFHAWDFPALGAGVVDFAYILGRLAERGFAGPCTIEIEGVKGEDLTPDQCVARVRQSVDYIRGLGYLRG
jgi:sugar phosphate isomerase/epimerase